MRCNFVVCVFDINGHERFLESFIRETWTDVMYNAVSFKSEVFADRVASYLANQLGEPVYARLRKRAEVR